MRDQQPGLTIGREVHVALAERDAEGAGDSLLAGVLHVERGLALALRHLHAGVEGAQRQHVAQAPDQLILGELGHPGADRLAFTIEHADDRVGEVADVLGIDIDRRALHRAGLGDHDMGEVGLFAGATGGDGNMEPKR